MRTDPILRSRVASEPVQGFERRVLPANSPTRSDKNTLVGAMKRVLAGAFGRSEPVHENPVVMEPGRAIYHFHEGDVFFPGTGNYVFDPPFETPLMTIWGNGFLRRPNTFNPLQPPQVFSQPNVSVNGIGGLISGQMATQPLEDAEL